MRILIVEDDEQLCAMLEDTLTRQGYNVDICNEGDDGLRWMQERAHDLVLLDRMLPRLDGASLLRAAREQGINTPVMMITAMGSVDNRVEGLETGADDYLVKPFSTKELLARIHALSRRPPDWSGNNRIAYGDLEYDPTGQILHCGEQTLTLSRREADLLAILFRSRERTLPRSTLLSYVWGPDAGVEESNLDSYIYYLRKHLKSIGSACEIKTVRNVGYKLATGPDDHVS